MSHRMKKFEFSKVWFLDGSERDLFSLCVQTIKSNKSGLHVHFLNNHVMQITFQSESFIQLLNESNSAVVMDGKPISWIARVLLRGDQNLVQIRGTDFMKSVLTSKSNFEFNHFFVGGSESTLNMLLRSARTTSNVAGGFSPPFTTLENLQINDIAQMILRTNANIVWVGLGTPKQDYVARELTRITNLPTLCVGAAFDFYTGNITEAPILLQKIGFEWLYRMIQEPKRLWKRYLFGNWSFFRVIMRHIFQ